MSFGGYFGRNRERKSSIKEKLVFSLLAIAVILLVSCVISVMEYSRMSNYVSELIAEDIDSINEANKLSDMCNAYNLEILSVIGDDSSASLPEFDDKGFREHCRQLPRVDDLMYSYSAYMLTALELEDVLQSDFIDSRSWYYERLQPRFDNLRNNIYELSDSIHADLLKNSATFERGFYRSIIPGIVATGVGILLVLMLLFFILIYYVNPLYHMLDSLKAYRSNDKKYTYEFDGDDQLAELNMNISEIADENQQLHRRIAAFKRKNGLEGNK